MAPTTTSVMIDVRLQWFTERKTVAVSIGTICQWRGRLPEYPHSIPTDHKVWLSTRDIPLQVGSPKVAPRFVGPLEIDKIINPVAVRLKLPSTVRIHPTFHASRLKAVHESSLVPASPPPPPTRLVDGGPGVCDTWWTGRVMAWRKGNHDTDNHGHLCAMTAGGPCLTFQRYFLDWFSRFDLASSRPALFLLCPGIRPRFLTASAFACPLSDFGCLVTDLDIFSLSGRCRLWSLLMDYSFCGELCFFLDLPCLIPVWTIRHFHSATWSLLWWIKTSIRYLWKCAAFGSFFVDTLV